MSSACGRVKERLIKASVDRAQRRQNRHDTKIFGLKSGGGRSRIKKRARSSDLETVEQRVSKCADCGSYEQVLTRKGPRPLCNSCRQKWENKRKERAAKNLQDVSSDSDSVEIISFSSEPGEKMYVKDLEAKLQQCKAELHAARAHQQKLENDLTEAGKKLTEAEKKISTGEEKNGELEKKVYTLTLIENEHTKLRAEKISWDKLQAESRKELEDIYEAERSSLEKKYSLAQKEIERLSKMVIMYVGRNLADDKHVEDPTIPILGKDGDNSLSGRSGVVTGKQQPAAQNEGSNRASNGIKKEHVQVVAEDSDYEEDVDVDIDTEPDRPGHTTARNPAADPAHVVNQGNAGLSGEVQRGGGAYDAQAGGGLDDGAFREESEEGGMFGSPQAGASDINSEDLIPLSVQEVAQQYVEQDFIYWMNTALRRPSRQEMRVHKMKYPRNKNPYYWVGLRGSEIINAYVEACATPPQRIPRVSDLISVFRLVPHFKFEQLTSYKPGGGHDFSWYLVWKHCVKISDYPGYMDMSNTVENLPRKRGRPRKVNHQVDIEGDEIATRMPVKR